MVRKIRAHIPWRSPVKSTLRRPCSPQAVSMLPAGMPAATRSAAAALAAVLDLRIAMIRLVGYARKRSLDEPPNVGGMLSLFRLSSDGTWSDLIPTRLKPGWVQPHRFRLADLASPGHCQK